MYRQAAEQSSLRIAGVSVHIGSQITDVTPFAAAMERVAELVRALRGDGHAVQYVDAGGGLGISYEAASLVHHLRRRRSDMPERCCIRCAKLKVHLLLEPGRSIVAPAGALLTRVIYTKTNGRKKFLVVDAAMNDLIRPSLYKAITRSFPCNGTRAAIRNEGGRGRSDLRDRRFLRARPRSAGCSVRAICWPFWMPAPTAWRWPRTTIPVPGRRRFWWTGGRSRSLGGGKRLMIWLVLNSNVFASLYGFTQMFRAEH